MPKKRIVILGAGLAGLSAAWHLEKKGLDYKVFEKEDEVGGLCRSSRIKGFTFDRSGHLLHFKHAYTFNLIRSLLGDNLSDHQRSAWIYYSGTFNRYPFQANLHSLAPEVAKECLMGFIEAAKNGHPKKKEDLDFLSWIDRTFGKGIAKHFMVPYNTKFWNMPPQKLTCDWFGDFIPVPSLPQVIEGTVEESHRQYGYNARFWYPRHMGIGCLPLAFKKHLKNVHTGSRVVEIDLDRKELKLASGEKEKFDYIIYTIPLPEIPNLIKKIPQNTLSLFKKLKWNSIFNLNLGLDAHDDSGRHWIYFPQKEPCFFRLGSFHNFYEPCQKRSSFYVEVSYSRDKPLDKNKVIGQIKADLKKIKLISSPDKILAEEINDIEYGYPIYDENYKEAREIIVKYLTMNNVIPCGRYGAWRYFSMEDAILDGKQVADIL
ncbi:MAG: FAD-dependent oxidoreductase [Candidatus Omnitrophica bacterium]|nr:FAD-dependent oxidoreductase [Candidatus Omnitrophota bacterium]MDD5609923.1 FAD-dependent oxidoreductase [Candidatus Omnitrophota bacterium]